MDYVVGTVPTSGSTRVNLRSVPADQRPVRVLAVASGGGHWTQLLRLRPAFEGCEVVYATTLASHAGRVDGSRFHTIPDASRWEPLAAARCALAVCWLLVRVRPGVIVSTGALPGYFAVAIGKVLLRRRTVWIDSIANADMLSLSGEKAGRFADVWLTQWEHLAREGGPTYAGSVLG